MTNDGELATFRAAMDASPDMMYVTDRATMRFLYANEAACRLTGYSLGELMAMGPAQLLRVSPAEVEAAFDEAVAAGPAGTVHEMKSITKDGMRTMVEIRRRAVLLNERWIVFTISQDISLRKRAEQALLRSNRMFAALSESNEAIMRATSREDLYKRVCEAAVNGGRFLATAVIEPHAETGRPDFVAVGGTALMGGAPGLAEAALRGASCVSDDFLKDERMRPWHEAAREAGIASGAAVPMLRGERVIGALLFYSDEKRAFDGEIVRLLERMAENAVFALDNFAKDQQRRLAEERVRHLAAHDALTGLPNRRMFSQLLGHAIDTAKRYRRSFAVLFIDLDGFKVVNDRLGHQAGDQLLQAVAERLKRTLRTSDIVARLGGDEFVALLQETDTADQVAAAARKILLAVAEPLQTAGGECRVSASIGISRYPADATDESSLMKHADLAMYRAKEGGRNAFRIHSAQD